MIVKLTGKLIEKAPTHVVLEVNNIAYEVRISLHTFASIKSVENCSLFTHLLLKEDAQILYGFSEYSEKQCFLQLIGVNGIGPRTALTVLSSCSPNELQQAINQGQVSILQSIKGIGPKAAKRIILELQGKIATELAGDTAHIISDKAIMRKEAFIALTKLGITPTAAEKSLQHIFLTTPAPSSLEEVIRKALRG